MHRGAGARLCARPREQAACQGTSSRGWASFSVPRQTPAREPRGHPHSEALGEHRPGLNGDRFTQAEMVLRQDVPPPSQLTWPCTPGELVHTREEGACSLHLVPGPGAPSRGGSSADLHRHPDSPLKMSHRAVQCLHQTPGTLQAGGLGVRIPSSPSGPRRSGAGTDCSRRLVGAGGDPLGARSPGGGDLGGAASAVRRPAAPPVGRTPEPRR